MSPTYTEDALIEQPSIARLDTFGWQTVNAYHEVAGPGGLLGMDNTSEIVLFACLLPALARLNPDLSAEVLRLAIEEQLDQLPEAYDQRLFREKCDAVYQHVYDSYQNTLRSIYDQPQRS